MFTNLIKGGGGANKLVLSHKVPLCAPQRERGLGL